jgi:hypothetical protein
VAALRLEMSCHRVTHDAEPDECNLCHIFSPEKTFALFRHPEVAANGSGPKWPAR